MTGSSGSISYPPVGTVPGVTDDTFSVTTLLDVQPSGAATAFMRRLVFDPDTGTITKFDTTLDGVTAYVVTGVVQTGVQTGDSVVSTFIRNTTGTAALDLKTARPGLQSVSLVVLVGSASVTTDDGTAVPVPAGVALTWSVADSDDSSISIWQVAGATPTSQYIVNATYKSTLAG